MRPETTYEGHVTYADGSVVSIQCFEGRNGECPDDTRPAAEVDGGGPLLGRYCEHPHCGRYERHTTSATWKPEYHPWHHGGWYVSNLGYPSGAVGCVSRHSRDGKWRIVCDPRSSDHTYLTRDAAAHAEYELAGLTPFYVDVTALVIRARNGSVVLAHDDSGLLQSLAAEFNRIVLDRLFP